MGGSMSEVVALLLDDAMPPERLGALLRGPASGAV